MIGEVPQHNMLWHYLGQFIVYTLLAVGLIYGAFYLMKSNPRLMNVLGILGNTGVSTGKKSQAIQIESSLGLEARKNLYVLRCENERFLVATSPEGTQFLSRLSSSPERAECVQSSKPVDLSVSDHAELNPMPPVANSDPGFNTAAFLKDRFPLPKFVRQLMLSQEGR